MDGAQVWQCHARHDALGALIATEASVGKARDQGRNEDRLKGETPHRISQTLYDTVQVLKIAKDFTLAAWHSLA